MLIINAKILTCENDIIIQNGFIKIENDTISSLGEMSNLGDLPSDTDIIDAKGKTVTPGFIDAHCHIGLCEDSLGFEGEDANEETDPVTPQIRALDAINPMERAFGEAVSAGVTTVCVAPGSANCVAGQIAALKTYGKRIDNMLIKDFSAMKLAFGENPKTVYSGKNQTPNTRMATASLVREAFEKAKRYIDDLDDALNANVDEDEDDTPPEYDAKCEALMPLLRGQIKAHIHAHRADDIFTAMRIADEYKIKYTLVHCTDGHLIADELKRDNALVMLGPVIGGRTKPELANHSVKAAAELEKEGVMFCITTDHPEVPVQMLALSAAICKNEGMSYNGALNAITINAAKILELDDKIGSIKQGKNADLLIFEGDPISGFNKPETVIINGKKVI